MTRPVPGNQLPAPSEAEQRQSERLVEAIRRLMQEQGGRITFAEYMERALYLPGLGYYATGQVFGDQGDFITAPELSPLFSRCVARQTAQVLEKVDRGEVLEFGAGTGAMAAGILGELQALDRLPERYYILDISGALRQRQRETLQNERPDLLERVTWLDALPASFRGVVLANEVLDAMPVHRVRLDGNGDHELYVTWGDDRFHWEAGPPSSAELARRLAQVRQLLGAGLDGPYDTEVNLAGEAWVRAVGAMLQEGAALLIDYGFPRSEFYHAQRYGGTLMCHYRHRAHDDPLILPGLQDITAHVDFTAMAEAAHGAGLDITGFSPQAYFLIGCGLESFLNELDPGDTKAFLTATQAIKKLTLPTEMGELFKVLAVTRGLDEPLIGFAVHDQRPRL